MPLNIWINQKSYNMIRYDITDKERERERGRRVEREKQNEKGERESERPKRE